MAENTEVKCQMIYLNLLRLFNSKIFYKNNDLSIYYIREFINETEKCDLYTNLSKEREYIKKDFGKESIYRIQEYKTTTYDENKAYNYLRDYNYWHKYILYNSLSWKNRVYYLLNKKYFF